MDEREATTQSGTERAKPSGRGPIIALVALVAVIVVAFVAYGQLVGSAAPSSSSAPAVSGNPAASGDAGSSGSTAGDDTIMLADYDATVFTEIGDPFTFTQIAGGKPLVINFWTTWCPYCVQEMGDFQAIYDDYGDRVSFAFVDCVDGTRETVQDGTTWIAENGYDLPVYFDTKQDAQYTLGIYSFPTTVVVSAEGEIMTISPGRISDELMRGALDSLLQG